jgi:Na+/H+ antiporter NhaD/arsenite permease-like protein
MDVDNIIYFQKFKPYISNYQYEKSSLFANIFCIFILLFFVYYFFFKSTKMNDKKK